MYIFRYDNGSRNGWIQNGNDLRILLGLSILSIFLYRIISAYMIYKLTNNKTRILTQLMDLEIYRTILISYKLKLAEPGYIQTWLQKLEATFESLPQAILQLSFLMTDNSNINVTIIVSSLLLSLLSMAERFERDDKVFFEFNCYYITKSDPPYISIGYLFRFIWRLLEISTRIFVLVLVWNIIGGYILSGYIIIEFFGIMYLSYKYKIFNLVNIIVAIPLGVDKKFEIKLLIGRFIENILWIIILWIFAGIDMECNPLKGCDNTFRFSDKIFSRTILILATIFVFLVPILYIILRKYFMLTDIKSIQATQERDLWVIAKTGDMRGIREMVEFGINPDVRNGNNETLLHVYLMNYSQYNQTFVDTLIFHKYFKVDSVSKPENRSLLHMAFLHKNVSKQCVTFLLRCKKYLTPNLKDNMGKNPVMYYLGSEAGNTLKDCDIKILNAILFESIYFEII